MRIPIVFGTGTAADAYLAEQNYPVPAGAYTVRFTLPEPGFGHSAGCACCTPRGPVAAALTAVFRARATGAAPFFSRLVVAASPAGAAAVAQTVEADVVAAARFSIKLPG